MVSSFYDWIMGVMEFVFGSTILNMPLMSELLVPAFIILVGFWFLYLLIIKPILFLFECLKYWIRGV